MANTGVNLTLLVETVQRICQLGALSPSGRCRTFDAAADGYGRGEGCAAGVLSVQPTVRIIPNRLMSAALALRNSI